MNYCTKCNIVFPGEDLICECDKEKYSWKKGEVKQVLETAVLECKSCKSIENLLYREEWKSGSYTFGNECICQQCEKKLKDRILREEAMNYIVIDNNDNEVSFFKEKREVESYFEDFEIYDSNDSLDILILKVEKIERKLTRKDFIPHTVYSEGVSEVQEKNTHIVIYNDTIYSVQEVIEPEIEYDGEYNINW